MTISRAAARDMADAHSQHHLPPEGLAREGCPECEDRPLTSYPVDPTESTRRAMVPAMPAELAARVAAGEQVWDTDALRAEFDVIGFMAPFVSVRRKADGVTGSLMFAHSPRFYFGWAAA